LIAAHRGAQRHARHPRTMMPFHLITPARHPTNTPRLCRVARAAECARLRSGFTNTSVADEPGPWGYRIAPAIGRAPISEPRCFAGTTTKENRSGPPALQPRSARKSRLVGQDNRLFSPLARQRPNPSDPYQLGTQGGACERSCSTIKYARSRVARHYADARLAYRGYLRPAVSG
jgi:hypothetical protein